MKIEKVQFVVFSADAMFRVISAFAAPFPSLDGIDGKRVWEAVKGDGDAALRVQDALDKASWGGEWPGSFLAHYKPTPLVASPGEATFFTLSPYVGDRFVRILPGYYQGSWESAASLIVEADYTSRPSSVAASFVERLALEVGVVGDGELKLLNHISYASGEE